jgi:hypothetical protein
LRKEIDALGAVRHLVSPNKLHYVHVCAWKRAYPEATAWASPGVRERAASRGAEEVCFGRDLADGPEEAWRGDLDQLIFRGSRFMEEVVFFHRKTRTLILADFIENFEPEKVGSLYVWLLRLAGVEDPDGKTPIAVRLTFLGRKGEARASLEEMLAWRPEKVIMAHGRPYYRDTPRQNCVARSAGSARRGSRKKRERVLRRQGHTPLPHIPTSHDAVHPKSSEKEPSPRTPVNKPACRLRGFVPFFSAC